MKAPVTRLFFYEPELRRAIWDLDKIRIPQRTLANWRARGLVQASARWMDGEPRTGTAARGGGSNACRYTVDDIARLRLVALARYSLRMSIAEIRKLLDSHGAELGKILRGRSDAALELDPGTRRVCIRRGAGGHLVDAASGQVLLDLRPLALGNEEAAKEAARRREAIGA